VIGRPSESALLAAALIEEVAADRKSDLARALAKLDVGDLVEISRAVIRVQSGGVRR
jgi:hypothetical protein